jgi:hypothetical protein
MELLQGLIRILLVQPVVNTGVLGAKISTRWDISQGSSIILTTLMRKNPSQRLAKRKKLKKRTIAKKQRKKARKRRRKNPVVKIQILTQVMTQVLTLKMTKRRRSQRSQRSLLKKIKKVSHQFLRPIDNLMEQAPPIKLSPRLKE